MLSVLAAVLAQFSNNRRTPLDRGASRTAYAGIGTHRRLSTTSLVAMIFVLAGMSNLCIRADAQVRFGSVLGVVADPSGATMSGANVKITNLGTNETRSTQTGSGGTFTFPNLSAGLYRVEVEMAGFKRFTQDRVEVQVDVATRVEARLQVGVVTESVVVTTEGPPLQTDSASLGTTISQQEVESIPLSGRNVNNMLTLVPGVVAQGGTYGNAVSNQSGGARTNAIGFGNYAIGGGFGNQSSFYIDGVASNAPAGNLNSLIPSQDAVQEFRVVTNNVAAEYGNYAGGVINLTTKSGTNAFHGTAYEYLRNKVLNANDYFSNKAGLARVPLIQNQFGGTLGGPIVKDKTFFFFGFEREVLKTGTLVTSTVPTTAELGGDFSAPGLPTIYDPTTGLQFQCNGVLNVICPNRLDPSAQALFAKSYPAAENRPGLLQNNFVVQEATGGINSQYNARVDHHFSDKNNLFARYAYWKADSNAYDAWGTHTQGQGHTGIYTHSAILGDTHAFNSSTILDLRLSYLRVFQHEFPDSQGVDLSQFGPGWTSLASQLVAPANYPAMSFSDSQGVSGSNGVGSQLFWHQNVYGLSGNLTKIVGRHQLKFGGAMRHVQWISDPENGVLTLNFDQSGTASSSAAGGSAVASALLGIVGAQGSQVAPGVIGGSRAYFTSYGFFVDDTFQATRKLTVTAGLRWDQPSVFSEANNNDTVFLPNQASPLGSILNPVTGQTQQLIGNVALVGSSAWPSQREDKLHWKLFSPRLGLAYRLTDKTVMRAAYGISYPPSTLSQDGPNLSPVNLAPTTVTDGSATVANPFPSGLNQPLRRNAQPSDFYGQAIFAMRVPGDPMPYVQQWNAAVERQIGKDASLTVAYAGSRGTHLLLQGWATVSNINLNQLPDQYFSLGPSSAPGSGGLMEQVPNPFFGVITTPGSPLSAPTVARGQLLLPFPQYRRVLFLDPHRGTSNYRSLQTSFMKRFGSKGILSVAYTWSRLMSNTDSTSAFLDEGFIFGGATQDNNHLEREYSVSSYDIPHNLSVGYGVDLPVGHNKHFLSDAHGILNGIVGGWRVNGITAVRSGVPISAYQFFPGSALSFLGGGQGYFGAQGLWMRTDLVSGCDLKVSGSRESRALNGWFNTACFQPVDTSTVVRFGNEPRNVSAVRMDHMNNWDFSIAKRNDITERVYLQFTAEFFNAFNHVRFGAPNTNITSGPSFGTVTSQANPPRAIQFGLRVGF